MVAEARAGAEKVAEATAVAARALVERVGVTAALQELEEVPLEQLSVVMGELSVVGLQAREAPMAAVGRVATQVGAEVALAHRQARAEVRMEAGATVEAGMEEAASAVEAKVEVAEGAEETEAAASAVEELAVAVPAMAAMVAREGGGGEPLAHPEVSPEAWMAVEPVEEGTLEAAKTALAGLGAAASAAGARVAVAQVVAAWVVDTEAVEVSLEHPTVHAAELKVAEELEAAA